MVSYCLWPPGNQLKVRYYWRKASRPKIIFLLCTEDHYWTILLCPVLCWDNNGGACGRRSPPWRCCCVVLGVVVLLPRRRGSFRPLGFACGGSSSLAWVLWGGAEVKAFACLQADDSDAFGHHFPHWRHHSFAPTPSVPPWLVACSVVHPGACCYRHKLTG